jgi:hypothetical protein
MNRSGPAVLLVASCAWLIAAGSLEAQMGRARAEDKRESLLKEHADYLQKARANGILEDLMQQEEGGQRAAAEALQRSVLGRDGGVNSEQLEKERRASELIEVASRELSDEAKEIVASRPMVLAQADPPVAPPPPLSNPGGVPVPKEVTAKPLPDGRKKLLAEITAEGAVHFNATTKIMVFTDEVVVDHTGFHLECDILEIILKASVELGAAATAPEESETGISATSVKGDDPIEKAIARGGTVTITKKDAQGKLKTGKARYVMYDAQTGDITMRDYPQVQSGQSLMLATDASTIIVMKADGNHYAVGPHRMEIIPNEGEKAPAPGAESVVPIVPAVPVAPDATGR